MKKIISVLLAIMMIFACTTVAFAAYSESSEYRLVAHRGMNELAPENTLPAFEYAGEYGYYGIEFDLYCTTDGVWMVSHDDSVERTTDGTGKISEMTYDEVMQCTTDSGTNIADYPDLKIPTLDQVLDICEKYSMHPYIEIKGGTKSKIDELMANLTERGLYDKAVIISTDKVYLKYVANKYPDITTWLISYFSSEKDIEFCQTYGLDGLTLNTTFFRQAILEQLQQSGLTMSFWTVDSLDDLKTFASYGAVDFTTNNLIYDEDGKATALQTGSTATMSALSRFIELVKQAIALVKTYIAKFTASN